MDESDEKYAAEYLRILNQGIIDTIREPLVIMDDQLHVIHASRNFYRFFKVTEQDTLGRKLSELGSGHWDIPSLQQLLTDILDRDEAIESFEVEHVFSKIGRKVMLLNARKIHQKESNSKTILLAVEDITVQKQAEDELKLLNERLRNEVDIKNRFFSVIAHDLKGPFNFLLGITQMISEMPDGMSREKLIEHAVNVNKAGEQVFDLLQNLLEWSRIQMEGLVPERQETSLVKLVEDCFVILQPIAKEKGIRLYESIDEISVYVDPDMAKTILRNLISNALKFTNKGGCIEVSCQIDEGIAHITVMDDGVGMTAEQAGRVFDLKRRSTTTGTAGEIGTGLGLPLCREILELHNGRIWADSVPGKGSCFHFTLPLSKPANLTH